MKQEDKSAKWLVTYRGCIPVNGHASQTLSTNRGLRSYVTLSMWLLPLPLGQTSTHSLTANTNAVLH